MLHHMNRAAAGKIKLVFVGGAGLNVAASSTPTFSLTGLTGGIASSPSAGDIVIACVGINNSTDRNIQCTTSGYTEIFDLFNNPAQFAAYYKILTSAETSISFSTGVVVVPRCCIHVWRYPNATQLDVAAVTNSTTLSAPNAPSITTVTNNAVVIAMGRHEAGSGGSALTVPTGMGNFFENSSTVSGTCIASILVSFAGSYDPPAFGGGGGTSTVNLGASIAIRPL